MFACLLAAFSAGAAASEECAARDNLVDDSTREAVAIYRAKAPASVTLIDGRRFEVRAGTMWAEVGRVSRGEVYARAEGAVGMMLVLSAGKIVGTFDRDAGVFCAARAHVPLHLQWSESR